MSDVAQVRQAPASVYKGSHNCVPCCTGVLSVGSLKHFELRRCKHIHLVKLKAAILVPAHACRQQQGVVGTPSLVATACSSLGGSMIHNGPTAMASLCNALSLEFQSVITGAPRPVLSTNEKCIPAGVSLMKLPCKHNMTRVALAASHRAREH